MRIPRFKGLPDASKGLFFLRLGLIALLQIGAGDYLKVFGAQADLLLITVLYASFSFSLKGAVACAVFVGLCKDIFSAGTFGLNTLLFVLWSFLVSRLSKQLILDSYAIRTLLIFIVAVSQNIILALIFSLFSHNVISLTVFIRNVFLGPVYTAAVSPLIIRLIRCA